jgi:hypothetical protein
MTILLNIINKIILSLNLNFCLNGRKKIIQSIEIPLNELVENHFCSINDRSHPCRESLNLALSYFEKCNNLIILETGSSAWGTNSSILFDNYIINRKTNSEFEGTFRTCDIRINPMLNLINQVSIHTQLFCSDSIKFLKNQAKLHNTSNYLIYLDSFDLEYDDPNPSGLHGFKEFIEIIPLLKKGSLLLIDDSPFNLDLCPDYAKKDALVYFENFGLIPGKGMFIDQVIQNFKNVKKIYHKYQIIYIIE